MTPPDLTAFLAAHRAAYPRIAHKPHLTPRNVLTLSGLPYLPLRFDFPVPHEAMHAEAVSAYNRGLAVCHREGESQGWKALMLHGLSETQTLNHRAYGLPDGFCDYRWTSVAEQMPVTTTFVRSLGYRDLERVRVLVLEPGGWIAPHTDGLPGLGPVNIALNNPPGCEFVMEGAGVLPFAPGAAIMPAVGRRHAVYNGSNSFRYHLLINGDMDLEDHWCVTLPRSYRALFVT